jgi:hypothetical protein
MTATGTHRAGQVLQGDWAKIRVPPKMNKNGRPHEIANIPKIQKTSGHIKVVVGLVDSP